MAPRREILDSEDDGSDFGDGALSGDETEMRRDDFEAARETVIDASRSACTDSTDPSFFQRVYDHQQAAAGEHHVIPDTAPAIPAASAWTELSSAPSPGQKPPAHKDPSSLTSITDPRPRNWRSKRTRDVAPSEVIDLTDLITPRTEPPSGASDVWDVPASTRSQQRTTRTYGKRKTAQLSLEHTAAPGETMPYTQDPYALPQSSPPVRKKRNTRGTPSSSAQQPPGSTSPVMLVHVPPAEEPPSSDRRTRRSSRKNRAGVGAGASSTATESSVPDTAPPSLYIAQGTLISSQKREYAVVGSSADAEALPAVSETFPGQSLVGGGQVYKSSGATTIAYPTPSRIGSSRRLADVAKEVNGVDVVETSLTYDVGYQQSSPDVLTDMTAGSTATAMRSRRKIASSGGLGLSELEPTPSTRRAKRRKVVPEVDDEPQELDTLQGGREDADALQQTAHVKGEPGDEDHPAAGDDVPALLPNTELTDVEPTEAPDDPPKPAVKNKRGRKKKKIKTPAPILDHDEPAAAEATPHPAQDLAEFQEPPTRRKCGRPRKSEPAKPQPEPIEQGPEQQHAEEVQTEVELGEAPQPLSEVSRNSQPDPGAGGNDADRTNNKENGTPGINVDVDELPKDKENEKQKQAAKDVKTGLQKVRYRVGLSRTSRIAPLLKSLKKSV
ncbi:hypothetical protein N658DRAFT_527274 [Parathielavia hyrcaniae]|uniref:AT hook domain-containing protein n=1 Tax=Parathielavia hyrcaniae TaxID=113614 RepID=A0AAN6SY45_9PEZI|nr:hypothetical protein N658DRAFT_527274 [Parathielavia hyrcaniae]